MSESEKEFSQGEKLPQTDTNENESKTQNFPSEVECSINYVLIDSDKESNEIEMS